VQNKLIYLVLMWIVSAATAFAQNTLDPEAAAQARLEAKTIASTRPYLSNDPAVLQAIILENNRQIESLRAQVENLTQLVASRTPTTQPNGAFPAINGVWQEAPGVLVTVTQTNGEWKAQSSFTVPQFGVARWEMKGTITSDGKINGTLRHMQAPENWNEYQSREAVLSKDGNTISGTATWDSTKHPFTWVRGDAIPKEPVEPKAGDSEDDLMAYAEKKRAVSYSDDEKRNA
jgi:hypothetical protein